MRKTFLTILSAFFVLGCMAQGMGRVGEAASDKNAYKQLLEQPRLAGTITPNSLFGGHSAKAMQKAENVDEEFIFDPQGEEQTYVMSLYSYDQTNTKFVSAQSLYSQVRYDSDGKTVYFRHLTKSLGVITWLKGEKRVMEKDSLEVGIHEGDVVIDVPFGQPLAYYKNKYLVFFCPMTYNDNTGNMEAQDNYTFIVRNDSLVQPSYPEATFQAAAGYVVVSEQTQGTLSLDIDHNMRLETKPLVVSPKLVPEKYVYSFINSYGNVYKKEALVKRYDNDLFMQLSTSAPDAYVRGTITDGEIVMESGQVITDSTFVYYYSISDPVYTDGEITDFVPTTVNRLGYDEATRTIAPLPADGLMGGENTFSVDYLDGMNMCMDYVTNPVLTVYGGDVAATPINPTIRTVSLDGGMMELSSGMLTFNYMTFVVPALDVEGNYINKELMTYRIYINDELYTFTPSVYRYLPTDMTDIPYNYADYDIYSYDQLKYVYLYFEKDQVQSLGVQSVYTVEGEERCSEIVTVRFDQTPDPDDTRKDNDLSLNCRLVDNMVKAGESLTLRGTVTNSGKNPAVGYAVSYTIGGSTITKQYTNALSAGKTADFNIDITAADVNIGEVAAVDVSVAFIGDVKDEDNSNNSASLTYGIYDESAYEPEVLLEEFTAESCGWCPYGAWRIHTALEEAGVQERVHWVCHHEGYGVDWLTVPESTTYCDLYGGSTFAPAWMVNRNQRYSEETYPVGGIPDTDDIKGVLQSALSQPCFVDVDIENAYNDGTLNIKVKTEKSSLFDVQCAKPYLTVFIVEDKIPARHQKTYDSHTIEKHYNALRAVLTDVWGDEISWTGDASEIQFAYTVPEGFALENVKVIAFVHENYDDINQRRVFNTAIANLNDVTAIKDVKADNNANTATYNLLGQKVLPTTPHLIIKNGRKYLK